MKRIYVISVMLVVVFLLIIVVVQNHSEVKQEQKYYIDAMIAAPVEDVNHEFEDYVLHLPKGYEITKEPNSITYVIESSDVVLTIDNTIKQVTDNYIDENDIKLLYEYNTVIDDENYTIAVWDSLEYENYLDVYFYTDTKGALAIIPDNDSKEDNLEDLISILKSISKKEGE